MSIFSERLKQLRAERGENQKTLAEYLNVSLQSYSTYENGREPSYDNLIKLARYFDVTTDYLVGNNEFKSVANKDISLELGLSEKAIENLKMCSIEGANFLIEPALFVKMVEELDFYITFNEVEFINALKNRIEASNIDKDFGIEVLFKKAQISDVTYENLLATFKSLARNQRNRYRNSKNA